MIQCRRLTPIIWLFALGAVVALPAAGAAFPPGAGERIVQALVAHGFESVAVRADDGAVTVWYENRIYRYELTALGVVAHLSAIEADSSTVLTLIPESRGVPILSVSARASDWLSFLRGDAPPEWFRERLAVHAGGDFPEALRARRGAVEHNPSRWRSDVEIRPLLELQFGIPDDPFQMGFWVAPEAVVSPARGALLTVQGTVRVTDEFEPDAPRVAPGRTTLSAAGWLPGAWAGAASAGYFPGDRYGFAGEMGRLFRDGTLELKVGGDLSGFLHFGSEVVTYSELGAWTAWTSGTFRTERIDLATTVTGGRFQRGDLGGRLDVARRVGEVEIAFFGIKTEEASLGGFRLNVPLPVAKQRMPARVRFATVPAFPWEYREQIDPAGVRVRLFDTLERFRKGLYPTFLRNNLADLRTANRYVEP